MPPESGHDSTAFPVEKLLEVIALTTKQAQRLYFKLLKPVQRPEPRALTDAKQRFIKFCRGWGNSDSCMHPPLPEMAARQLTRDRFNDFDGSLTSLRQALQSPEPNLRAVAFDLDKASENFIHLARSIKSDIDVYKSIPRIDDPSPPELLHEVIARTVKTLGQIGNDLKEHVQLPRHNTLRDMPSFEDILTKYKGLHSEWSNASFSLRPPERTQVASARVKIEFGAFDNFVALALVFFSVNLRMFWKFFVYLDKAQEALVRLKRAIEADIAAVRARVPTAAAALGRRSRRAQFIATARTATANVLD